MKAHWTARSIKDYLFRIAADFIAQLENKMKLLPISQSELANRLGVTRGSVSLWMNHPGNVKLDTMIEYAKALGMKVSVVAYEDDDPENKKGPIDSEIFKICWEQLGKPRDFWDVQEIVNTNITAANYPFMFQSITGTVHIADVPTKIYHSKLQPGWEISLGNIATWMYFPVEGLVGNQTQAIFEKDKLLPS